MKVRKTGNEWSWITFKYENVPTFCFICGILGHSDKFCSRLFEVPEKEISRPYGVWMRAPLRRQTNLIGSKWLRNGSEHLPEEGVTAGGVYQTKTGGSNLKENFTPEITGKGDMSMKGGIRSQQNLDTGEKSGNSNQGNLAEGGKIFKSAKSVILENKKRRTDSGEENILGQDTEIEQESDTEVEQMDQDANNGSKNGFVAGSGERARQAL
ncbi:hypothetical protein DCAR_0728609 [Daucus carota subsp. sativus]|uniref:Zinc knuckle CX2CX4HX4C domain-containing protein n=1 Tax=Daucus carota subsp. sativus TaxID=79200 RepID=A0AAF1B763_DAUCS|nr:hypothetical protein DCAR_0728609 [Daucus carota subsp. sativus]